MGSVTDPLMLKNTCADAKENRSVNRMNMCSQMPRTSRPSLKRGTTLPKTLTGPFSNASMEATVSALATEVVKAMYLKPLKPVTKPSAAIVKAQIG